MQIPKSLNIMETWIALLVVVSVGVFVLYFRKNRFLKKKNDGANQSYITFMQNLCEDEFVLTIGNAGYYELDNNLIVSSRLYIENEGSWSGKEVVQINVMCASPIEEHTIFFERLKKHLEEWRGDATCTCQYGKTNAYFELEIRVLLDISVLPSMSAFYKKIIAFLADECGLSEVVRYVKQQVEEDTYFYKFVGMQLNLLAVYSSAENEWSSDMEDMHDTLADIDIGDTEISSQFIASEEFEEAYKHVK